MKDGEKKIIGHCSFQWQNLKKKSYDSSCRGRDRMVVGFTTTCAISAYHH